MKLERDKNWLKNIEDNMKSKAEDEIAVSTQKIADDARRDVPVDDGILKNSIVAESKELDGEIRVTAHYAPYIEFGTGGMVDVPTGMEDYAIKFKGQGKRKVNLAPQPYLYPNFFTESKKLLDRLNKVTDGSK